MNPLTDRREFLRQTSAASLACLGALVPSAVARAAEATGGQRLRAGTAQVDITPQEFPVLVCGGFLSRSATEVHDPLLARCLILDDGAQRLLIMVADTIEIPYDMQETVKAAAAKATGIPTDRMLISATHTHSGGSLVSALGTKADPAYCEFLPGKLVECITQAAGNLQPARIGWSSEDYPEGTHCRVFIRRPDCLDVDPLGRQNVRAMMHPGHQNPQFIGPCGPSDPQVSVLAVQTPEGKPIALLANYSMHYFGAEPISADYYGDFVRLVSRRLAADDHSFIAMMSHGTSGDQQWQDYANPAPSISRLQYATEVAEAALRAYQRIEFHDSAPLAMAERRLTIRLEQPDAEAQAWADKTMATMNGRDPQTMPEVYAREIVLLREMQQSERKLQVIRIGDLGIAALPAEVYAITGLKLKQQCPLSPMFNIELANGSIGYIPPPELRPLGGYNTWPARHTATQNDIETIMVKELLEMFEAVTGRPRRKIALSQGPAAARTLAQKPLAYWQLGEIEGVRAWDASGHDHHGTYETGYAFYLDGPDRDDLRSQGEQPRAVQFAGGRMKAQLDVGRDYVVEFWFWNGLPNDNRSVTGYLISLGPDGVKTCPGDHLGISGTDLGTDTAGRLFFFNGDEQRESLSGGLVIAPKTWTHVRLVRRGEQVAVHLNGDAQPVFSGNVSVTRPAESRDVFVGGRSDNFANFEGRLAEVAIFAG
ncbi:MAG: LamG-like jellyroll fold domain-containing protein [Pirellulaceae bacterium]